MATASFSAADLLNVWEQNRLMPSWQQATALLALADPQASRDELQGLSIGLRNQRLLALREAMFGSRMESLATCPACAEVLDLAFHVADLHAREGPAAAGPIEMEVDGCALVLRAPASHDLQAISGCTDPADASRRLLERCIVSARREGCDLPVELLPQAAASAAAERIAQADALADIQLALTCPSCGHQWQALFDVLTFFWTEIQSWAHRVFREVHRLALAYGWSERDILAMSPTRRRIYLEMLDA